MHRPFSTDYSLPHMLPLTVVQSLQDTLTPRLNVFNFYADFTSVVYIILKQGFDIELFSVSFTEQWKS